MDDFEREEQGLNSLHKTYNMELLPEQIIEEFARPFSTDDANFKLCGQEIDRVKVRYYWEDIQQLKQLLKDSTLNQIFHFKPVENGGTHYELSFILRTFEKRINKKRSLIVNLSALQPHIAIQKRVLSYLMDEVLLNRLSENAQIPVAIFIDEIHRYIPEQQPINENGLFHLLREGRKHKLNVVVSTQSLKDLPEVLRGQFGSNLIHRYQSKEELEGFGLSKRLLNKLPKLGVGEALLLTADKRPSFVKIQKPNTM